MDIKKQLPNYTKLDIEFSKNAEMIYDLFATTLKKRFAICDTLINDIVEFMKVKVKSKRGWKVAKEIGLWGDIFPRVINSKTEFSDFGSSFLDDISGFEFYSIIEKNTKKKQAFVIQIFLTLNTINWYIGQFSSYEDSAEYYTYEDYKNLQESIKPTKSDKYKVDISYPGTIEAMNDSEKYLGLTLDFNKVKNNDDILSVHEKFKKEAIPPFLKKVKW